MAQGYHDGSPFVADDSSAAEPRTPVSPLLPAQQLPPLRTAAAADADAAGDRHGHDLNSSHLVSPIMSRTPSIASDSRLSALSGGTGTFPANPANVRPSAAYVAPFGAAQVVSEHHNAASHDDDRPSKDDVSFTPPALALINAFLDQLLFSFLSNAKSTTLTSLRPAVTDILRNKLARDAIASANEELADLLSGGDEDDEKEAKNNSNDASKWDLELVWRRTRLRVMVYMRLGEMEDDDEERYVKEQDLFANGERGRFSSTAGLVSWSAAIFLTSVLEYVAEQTLQVAGSAASTRLRQMNGTAEGKPKVKSIVVEDQDAERIALNPALGRLWRSWRKTVRANVRPTTPSPRDEVAVVSPAKSVSTFRESFGTAPESVRDDDDDEPKMRSRQDNDLVDTQYPVHVLASNIRLPIGDPLRDVDEIEVPGLARDPSETASQGTATPIASQPDRRRSFSHYQARKAEAKALSGATGLPDEDDALRPLLQRKRSTSVPAPYRNLSEALAASTADKAVADDAIETQKTLSSEIPEGPVYGPVEQKDFDFTMDEVDKRKSLIDIKSLLAAVPNGQAGFITTKEGYQDRPASARSDQSFSLGNKENGSVPYQPIAERQHLGDPDDELANIGVATTSDQAVAPERPPSTSGTRGVSPNPLFGGNISRASSVARSRYSPSHLEEAQQMQNQAVVADEVSARDRPIEPNEQTLKALRESVHRASSPQAAQQEVTDQPSQSNRKSMALQYPISAFNTSQSEQAVEHPVLRQKKALEPWRDPNQITSASIRGPEDFDNFVQGDEVHKYTLTPEPIRDAPASNAQSLAQLTGQVPPVVQSTTANDKFDQRYRRSQLGKSMISVGDEDLTDAEKKRRRWSVIKPPSRNSSVHRRSGLIAREPRVITESTRDFADFIRSTKPSQEQTIQPLNISNRHSTNYSLPRTQSFTGERTKSLTRSDIAAGYAPPVPVIPSKGRQSLQPRTATGNSEETGELSAFIRDGPKENGQHRISRNVAPFRSTMDSDQFDALKATARPSSDSRNSNIPARASMALNPLKMNGISNVGSIAHPAYGGQPQSFVAPTPSAGTNDPQRKQYRNKDPYAIDDDDDEDDISALPKRRRAGDSQAGQQDGDSKPIASAASLAQARELMERARAKGSYNNGKGEELSALPVGTPNTAPESRPATTGRAGDRLGLNDRSQTSDLADFLRNSGPPSAAPAPSVGRGVQGQKSAQQQKEKTAVKEKKSRGFFSFLRRRPSSKGKAARHSDMP